MLSAREPEKRREHARDISERADSPSQPPGSQHTVLLGHRGSPVARHKDLPARDVDGDGPRLSGIMRRHASERRAYSDPLQHQPEIVRTTSIPVASRPSVLKGVYTTMWVRMGGLAEASAAVSPMTRV